MMAGPKIVFENYSGSCPEHGFFNCPKCLAVNNFIVKLDREKLAKVLSIVNRHQFDWSHAFADAIIAYLNYGDEERERE
jgi:hypothetical protein